MPDLAREANMLGALLEETRGVVGVALGTAGGQLRAVVGSVVDGDASAAVAAALTEELARLGAVLGLGKLGVASIKAPTASRVFARQAGAAIVIELDPRRPLGELEAKLQSLAWAPEGALLEPTAGRPGPPGGLARPAGRPARAGGSPRTIPPPIPDGPLERPTMPNIPMLPSAPSPGAMDGQPSPSALGSTSTQASNQAPAPSGPTSSAMKAVGGGSVFSGDLDEFSLPDLLEFLRNSHRTGLLVCTTSSGVGTIQLSRGMIIGADSPNALDLREHFLTSPEVDPARRRVLATLPAECFGDELIESVLVSRELALAEEVERVRVARIYSAFREMMGWTDGRFSFDPGVAIVSNPALALSAQTILMDIYQEQDEQGR